LELDIFVLEVGSDEFAKLVGSADALASLRTVVDEDGNDAAWLRARFAHAGTLPDVVRQQAALFMG